MKRLFYLSFFRDFQRPLNWAEAKVLWNLLAGLETKLIEPFSDKYSGVLKMASENIIGGV